MGILSWLFGRRQEEPAAPIEAPSTKVVTHKIAGTSYRQEILLAMGEKNPEYNLPKRELLKLYPSGVTVYEYNFYPQRAYLVPEPENPEDPKAIKVVMSGAHVGYIKSGSCAHIRRLMRESRIEKIEARIIGGKYKNLYSYEVGARRAEEFEFDKGATPFGVRLDITERLAP